MNDSGIKAEDILKDNEDFIIRNNKKLRKGSITAAIQNVKQLVKQPKKTEGPYWDELVKISKEVLEPLGFYQVLSWNDEEINKALLELKDV